MAKKKEGAAKKKAASAQAVSVVPSAAPATIPVEEKKNILDIAVAPKKMGRPPKYNLKLGIEICRRLARGESILQMCRLNDHLPEANTIYMWLLDANKAEFLKMYEAARTVQADVYFDQITEISDNSTNDWMDREVGFGDTVRTIKVPDYDHINRSRLMVDTRKWMIARMNRRKYGDTIDVTSGNKPVKQSRPVSINYIVPLAPTKE